MSPASGAGDMGKCTSHNIGNIMGMFSRVKPIVFIQIAAQALERQPEGKPNSSKRQTQNGSR